MDDGAAGQQLFLVDDGVALGAGRHQRLAVGVFDGQGAGIAARFDQQPRLGFVARRQQEGAQHRHQHGGGERPFEFAPVDEKQAGQVAEGTDFYHVWVAR